MAPHSVASDRGLAVLAIFRGVTLRCSTQPVVTLVVVVVVFATVGAKWSKR